MLAPFRRGVGDLAGLGVRLDACQVAMLEQDRGLALCAWAIPDPYNFIEDNGYKLEELHPVRGWEPVLHPVVLEYDNTNPVERGTGWYSEGKWHGAARMVDCIEDVYDTLWSRYPSLIGPAEMPIPQWPEYGVFRIWDCWPIDQSQADIYTRIAQDGWNRCAADAFNSFIQHEEGWSELDQDDPYEQEIYEELKAICLDADGCIKLTVADLTPKLQWDHHEDLRHIWANLKASSRRGWRGVLLSTDRPNRPTLRHEEGVFSPWF